MEIGGRSEVGGNRTGRPARSMCHLKGREAPWLPDLETNPKYFPPELKAIAFQVIQDLLNLREGEV